MPVSNAVVGVILRAVIGALIGGGAFACSRPSDGAAAAGSQVTSAAQGDRGQSDLDVLRSDVARLKANAPSQSHTMSDVGYHWTNLWFAGEKKNWPLAMFSFQEARNHIV